jgi:hypothetical protein
MDKMIEIKKNFNIERIKSQKTEFGYEGTIINIKNQNGSISEIQVNTPQMIYAKNKSAKAILGNELYNKIKSASGGLENGLGHKYYEEYRILSDTEQQSERGRKLAEQAKAYYEKIRSIKF